MEIPLSVHVRITPDNLKDYVGLPIYQKDSHLLVLVLDSGYLGNEFGAVMPIEAMVRFFPFCFRFFSKKINYKVCRERRTPVDW